MPSGTNWGTLALQQVPDFPPGQYAVVSLQSAAPASTVLAQTVALTSTAATTGDTNTILTLSFLVSIEVCVSISLFSFLTFFYYRFTI